MRRPKPLLSPKRIRQAKKRAAENRRAFLQFAIGSVIAAAVFAIVLSVPPQMSPEEVAAAVKAQKVRAVPAGFGSRSATAAALTVRPTQSSPGEAAATPATNHSVPVPPAASGYLPIGFEKLSAFPFFVTDQMVDATKDPISASLGTLSQIPEEIRGLNQRKVSIRGFMLPIKYEGKLATEFLLLRNQGLCCYGMPPKITEWVNVRAPGRGVRATLDEPVTVCGTLHVGDVRDNGSLLGIYSLEADGLKGPGW